MFRTLPISLFLPIPVSKIIPDIEDLVNGKNHPWHTVPENYSGIPDFFLEDAVIKNSFQGNKKGPGWRTSGKVSLSGALALPLFAHLDEYLENLLDIGRIDVLFNGGIEGIFKEFTRPFPVMDRQPLIGLDLGYLSCNLLSLGDEIDYLQVDPVDLRSQGIYRHSI